MNSRQRFFMLAVFRSSSFTIASFDLSLNSGNASRKVEMSSSSCLVKEERSGERVWSMAGTLQKADRGASALSHLFSLIVDGFIEVRRFQ